MVEPVDDARRVLEEVVVVFLMQLFSYTFLKRNTQKSSY